MLLLINYQVAPVVSLSIESGLVKPRLGFLVTHGLVFFTWNYGGIFFIFSEDLAGVVVLIE